MAVQKTRSGLIGKYGSKLNDAVQQHNEDATDYGFIKLPPGINNGVAQLISCKFDTYKKGANQGEYYFQARGMVIEPLEVMTDQGVQRVRGLHTMIMEPVCATKTQGTPPVVTTVEEHISEILNHMRMLGGEEFTKGAQAEDLEALAAALEKAAPYFKFSTSKSNPPPGSKYEPRVWENWHGTRGLEDYTPPADERTQDDSGGEEQEEAPPPASPRGPKATPNGQKSPTRPALAARPEGGSGALPAGPAKAPAGKTAARPTAGLPVGGKGRKTAPPPEPEPDASDVDQGDTDALLERALEGDDDAMQALAEMAIAANVPEDVVSAEPDWNTVVGWIRGEIEIPESAELVEDDGASEQEWVPEKGKVYYYKPVDPKTHRPGKKKEHEILSVNETDRTVTLRNLDTRKVVMGPDGKKPLGVSFDDLEGEDE